MKPHHLLLAAITVSVWACDNKPSPPPPMPQDDIKVVQYTNNSTVYYGDPDGIQISNHYRVTLYTEMEINDQGYPVGPGTMLRLSLNTLRSIENPTDLSLPQGDYLAAMSAQDFRPFTFNYGYTIQMDLPDGKVEMPDGSFYGEIPSGQTTFPADLLTDGKVTVAQNSDNTYTISGVVAGDKYTKRYFTFTGKIDVIDRSQGEPTIENTTLQSDLTLSNLTQARLEDRGDYYFLGDESYRTFNLYLAESTINLSDTWAAGTGNLLQIEFFVAFDADVNNGIPAGTYDVTTRTTSGGLARPDIVAGKIVPGYPNKFTFPEGAWYFGYQDGIAKQYARIDGGTMKVIRDGDSHNITIELKDCAKSPNSIKTTFSQSEPITVFKFPANKHSSVINPIKSNRK